MGIKKKIAHLMMLSCKKASLLIEKKHKISLSYIENMQLKWHLSICQYCSRYEKQSYLIEQVLRMNYSQLQNLSKLKLDKASKDNMKALVEKNIK